MSEFDRNKEQENNLNQANDSLSQDEMENNRQDASTVNNIDDSSKNIASDKEYEQNIEEASRKVYGQDEEENTREDYLESEKDVQPTERLVAAATEENVVQRTDVRSKGNRNSKVKGFFSLLAAGIVGSALTMFTLPQTNLFDDQYAKLEQQVEELSTQVNSSNSSSTITAQATSTTSASSASTSIADMVETSSKAIVGIVNLQAQTSSYSQSTSEDVESGSGSGIIFKKDDQYAYIVTNNHVIEGANSLEISLYSGDKTEGTLIGADALTDLAVVRIDAEYATDTINFGDSSTLRPGDQVWAIGNPLGLDLSRTVTQGIVSAVDRSITVTTSAGDWEFNVIQTDAAINPGNSGGALINSSGQVIGINSLKISDDGVEGLGFAIPSNDLIPIVNEIIENGKVERPYIGVGLASLEEVPRMYLQDLPNEVSQGVMITNIDSSSAAAKAGLEVQDVIVSIDGTELTGSSDLRKYLYTEVQVGDTVKLEVYHDGELKTVELTLTSN